ERMRIRWILFVALAITLAATLGSASTRRGPYEGLRGWQVHEPLVYSNLALFPVTHIDGHDSSGYLTLDEGLASGEVEVTELGAGLIRRRPGLPPPTGAQVNTVTLINHSKRALLLLAGEIVTGGKQDRVISKDRIVPPGADPLPLDVFCVEPGRWTGASLAFEGKSFMAAPHLREKAAVAKNQQEVWDAAGALRSRVAARVPATQAGAAEADLNASSSYAQLERSDALKGRIDQASNRLQRDYERALREALRGKKVVGVIVAINGEVVWADLFADPGLFERYWPKLLRSYVVEALSVPVVEHAQANVAAAEKFLLESQGREITETEPGEYRLRQVEHPRYNIFELASLLEKGEPMMHFNKLRKERAYAREPIRPMLRPQD
ncbi:MAG: ARPP-1 family domain-containing protein, partial [Candidatus Acidiferrales bacterium]